jgi:hypothetical protein
MRPVSGRDGKQMAGWLGHHHVDAVRHSVSEMTRGLLSCSLSYFWRRRAKVNDRKDFLFTAMLMSTRI